MTFSGVSRVGAGWERPCQGVAIDYVLKNMPCSLRGSPGGSLVFGGMSYMVWVAIALGMGEEQVVGRGAWRGWQELGHRGLLCQETGIDSCGR